MKAFSNSRRDSFIDRFPQASLEDIENSVVERCKFNFSYFQIPENKTGFEEWSKENLLDLIDKLKEYCKYPLDHWRQLRVGKSGTVFSSYGAFPNPSGFSFPKNVPAQVDWGRFRLDWSGRLCGFTIPKEYQNKPHQCGKHFDCNTFYVVFIDDDHDFYRSKKEAK